jgi:hypothetical protein
LLWEVIVSEKIVIQAIREGCGEGSDDCASDERRDEDLGIVWRLGGARTSARQRRLDAYKGGIRNVGGSLVLMCGGGQGRVRRGHV